MKKRVLFLIIIICTVVNIFAQSKFTVNNETLPLKIETEGELDLFSYKDENKYRLFIRDKNEKFYELLNTKKTDNYYSQEYITVLNMLTEGSGMSTTGIGFGRYSLKQFIKAYNSKGNARFAYTDDKVYVKSRLGIFAGISNHPFIENVSNSKSSFLYTEFEIFEESQNPKQSGFLSIEHAFESNTFKYSFTEFALGYRYRVIRNPKFNLYGNLQLATYTFSKQTLPFNQSTKLIKSSTFRAPLVFGIGTEFRVFTNSFLTLAHNKLFGLFIENSDNLPIDFMIGFKFNL